MTEAGKLPSMMTAIEISTPGGPEVLKPVERPTPHPGAREAERLSLHGESP